MIGNIDTISQPAVKAGITASTGSAGTTGFQTSMISTRKTFPLKLLFSLSMGVSRIFRSKRVRNISLAKVFGGAFGWSTFVSLIFNTSLCSRLCIASSFSYIIVKSHILNNWSSAWNNFA